jgi:hypothetical protein
MVFLISAELGDLCERGILGRVPRAGDAKDVEEVVVFPGGKDLLCWYVGMLECWNYKDNPGMLECWNAGMLE